MLRFATRLPSALRSTTAPRKSAVVAPPRTDPLTVRAVISPSKIEMRPTLLVADTDVFAFAATARAWPVWTTKPFSGKANAASTAGLPPLSAPVTTLVPVGGEPGTSTRTAQARAEAGRPAADAP